MEGATSKLRLSQEAAIVIGLAATALPFAESAHDEAERWLRVLRLHGRVGETLQALGVGEAPLTNGAHSPDPRTNALDAHRAGEDTVATIAERALRFADGRGSGVVCTVDVLFAVLEAYGGAFDRALYIRGTSRRELLDQLTAAEREPFRLASER